MVEYAEVVVCRHPNLNKDFMFRAPEGIEKTLGVGDWVLCDTCKGSNQIARCITPQFRIADFQLKEFYGLDMEKLRPVTAYMVPVAVVYTPTKE